MYLRTMPVEISASPCTLPPRRLWRRSASLPYTHRSTEVGKKRDARAPTWHHTRAIYGHHIRVGLHVHYTTTVRARQVAGWGWGWGLGLGLNANQNTYATPLYTAAWFECPDTP